MNERVLVLRDSIVKITQMLAGKSIKVTQQGMSAYVKADHMGRPIVVNLPFLPDNASDELCAAIQGFLDHEVAHILFSDFGMIEKAVKGGFKPMLNMLEDARIERCMAEKFSGCGHNLSVTGKFFLDKYVTPKLNEAMASHDPNKVVGVLMTPLIRAMSGQFIFKEYMNDKMSLVQPVYDKIKDLEGKIATAKTTKDMFDLASEIQTRLRDGEPPKGGGKKGEGEEEGMGAPGKGAGKPSGKPKGKSSGKPKACLPKKRAKGKARARVAAVSPKVSPMRRRKNRRVPAAKVKTKASPTKRKRRALAKILKMRKSPKVNPSLKVKRKKRASLKRKKKLPPRPHHLAENRPKVSWNSATRPQCWTRSTKRTPMASTRR
jgi:hypothetical protein